MFKLNSTLLLLLVLCLVLSDVTTAARLQRRQVGVEAAPAAAEDLETGVEAEKEDLQGSSSYGYGYYSGYPYLGGGYYGGYGGYGGYPYYSGYYGGLGYPYYGGYGLHGGYLGGYNHGYHGHYF